MITLVQIDKFKGEIKSLDDEINSWLIPLEFGTRCERRIAPSIIEPDKYREFEGRLESIEKKVKDFQREVNEMETRVRQNEEFAKLQRAAQLQSAHQFPLMSMPGARPKTGETELQPIKNSLAECSSLINQCADKLMRLAIFLPRHDLSM